VPKISPEGWIGGSALLLLACLLPPFILLVPVAFLLALGAGAVIPRWLLLLVPPAAGLALSLAARDADATAAYVVWTVILELGLAGGIALRLREGAALAAVVGATLASLVLVAGYDVSGREPPCHDTSALGDAHPEAIEFRNGDSAWGQHCEAIGPDGQALGRQTYPTRSDWGIAAVVLVAPLGVRELRRRRRGSAA
jgi:hypothetical protein